MSENEINDFKKFFVEKGEVGFSPERNKSIVENSIKKYEKKRKQKAKEFDDALAWRSEAAASYALYLDRGGSMDVDKYFGRVLLSELHGRRIVDEIKYRMRQKYIDDIIHGRNPVNSGF